MNIGQFSLNIYKAIGGWVVRANTKGGFAYSFEPDTVLTTDEAVVEWVRDQLKARENAPAEDPKP